MENTKNKMPGKLRVYRKESKFKEQKYWYSATRSDGASVVCIFKCEVPTDSVAFEISNVVGNLKRSEVVKDGETYINYRYYINSCEFSEIEGEELPI